MRWAAPLLLLVSCSGLPVEAPTFGAYNADIEGDEQGQMSAQASVTGQWADWAVRFSFEYEEMTEQLTFCLEWGDQPQTAACYTFEPGPEPEPDPGPESDPVMEQANVR